MEITTEEEQRSTRSNAGAPVSDQQMSLANLEYPVDRYLVESSKKIDMVNFVDDDLWNVEPALRPEDEIILRKLQEMLQSTAEDLKVLSGELINFHESKIQVKTLPTPLDEDFNNKVHIEEVVNAKFHGKKIVENPNLKSTINNEKLNNNTFQKMNNIKQVNTSVQVNTIPVLKKKKNRNLGITKPETVEINDSKIRKGIEEKRAASVIVPSVSYTEFTYEYEPKILDPAIKLFRVQNMPSVNIRSELIEQQVLQIDIEPNKSDTKEKLKTNSNVAVIEINHDLPSKQISQPVSEAHETEYHQLTQISDKRTLRKISMISTCESSESTNNVLSLDMHRRFNTQKQSKSPLRISPKTSPRTSLRKSQSKNDSDPKRNYSSLEAWKKKLNSVYGKPLGSKKSERPLQTKSRLKNNMSNKSNHETYTKTKKNFLNNTEYIPYSKLTLGGVRVSDIEREISDGPIKNDIPLSPILDKIISSKENSFNDSPKKSKKKSPKLLTTSDENLLREVIKLENQVSKTLSKSEKNDSPHSPTEPQTKESNSSKNTSKYNDSYDDDFEATDNSEHSNSITYKSFKAVDRKKNEQLNENSRNVNNSGADSNNKETTYVKASNLSFKNSVEVYEFVHSVDTQDSATQSNTQHALNLKETQTSPRNDTPNLQPIHNDLWPSIDPEGEVENMFKLEKDFIKKLIIEEYGEILEKNIDKPSTSKDCNDQESRSRNVATNQKNTQTSPAHVKSVMTSPKRTKTRTTSPFIPCLNIDQQTSPLIFLNNQEVPNQSDDERSEPEDLGISVNLSSPRFSLRLPETSREVLTNLEHFSRRLSVSESKNETDNQKESKSKLFVNQVRSSTSLEVSSSEMSSLGEVKFKLKRRLRRTRIPTISESSSTSTVSKSSSDFQIGSILPLRSEGEVSVGIVNKKPLKRSTDEDQSCGQL